MDSIDTSEERGGGCMFGGTGNFKKAQTQIVSRKSGGVNSKCEKRSRCGKRSGGEFLSPQASRSKKLNLNGSTKLKISKKYADHKLYGQNNIKTASP